MLTKFTTWVTKEQKKLENWGYEVEITQFPINVDKPEGFKMDLYSQKYIARITLFDSGKCQLEIINIMSEDTILFEYLQLDHNEELDKAFKNFLEQLQK